MKRFFKQFIVTATILGTIVMSVFAPYQQAYALGDEFATIGEFFTSIIGTAKQIVSTTLEVKQGFAEEVLNVIAVVVAQKASALMSQKIANWIATAGTDEGGKPLVTKDDFKKLFADVKSDVLQSSVSVLVQYKNTLYDPTAEGLKVVVDPETNVPGWMQDKILELRTFTSGLHPISAVGVKEATAYHDAAGVDPVALLDDIEYPGTGGLYTFGDDTRFLPQYQGSNHPRATDVIWIVKIGLVDCTTLTFYVNSQGDPVNNPQDRTPIIPDSDYIPRSGTYKCEGKSPEAVQIAREVVANNGKSFDEIVLETFTEKIPGVEIKQFLNDVKKGATADNPYLGWELLREESNNPVGVRYAFANLFERKLQAEVKDTELDYTSSGIKAATTCVKKQILSFRDGEETKEVCVEEIVDVAQGLVADQVREAFTSAYGNLENVQTWQQAIPAAAMTLVLGLIEGGSRRLVTEITDKEPGYMTASVNDLGGLDVLDPKFTGADGIEVKENSWQQVADKEVDFSNINKEIALTSQEAETIRRSVAAFSSYPGLAYVLDTYCVMGPGFGFEARLKTLVQNSTTKLTQKASTAGEKDAEAYQNLYDFIQRRLQDHVNYTKQAMVSNPWPGQAIFQDEVRRSIEEITKFNDTKIQSSKKRTAASMLVTIRDVIRQTAGTSQTVGGQIVDTDMTILLRPAPKWPENLKPPRTTNQTTQTTTEQERGDIAVPLSAIEPGASQLDRATNINTGQTETLGAVSPATANDTDNDGIPDADEIAICDLYGLCPAPDTVDLTTDTDGDGTPDYNEYLAATHPKYVSYDNIRLPHDLGNGRIENYFDQQGNLINEESFEVDVAITNGRFDINRDGVITGVPLVGTECPNPANPSGPPIECLGGDLNGDQIISDDEAVKTPINPEGRLPDGYYFGPNGIVTTPPADGLVINEASYDVPDLVDYLSDLEAYTQEFNTFVEGLTADNKAAQEMRTILSRVTSLYLGVQKDIAGDESVRRAETTFQEAREKVGLLEQTLDECYQIFYRIDKGDFANSSDGKIPRNLIPRKTIAVPGFGAVQGVPDYECDGPAGPNNNPQYCYGHNNAILDANGQPTGDYWTRGENSNKIARDIDYVGADLYGYAAGRVISHASPNFTVQQLQNTTGDPLYRALWLRWLEGYRIDADGDGKIKDEDREQTWPLWMAPQEFPATVIEGDRLFDCGNNCSDINKFWNQVDLNGTPDVIAPSTATIYSWWPYSDDRQKVLYCSRHSILHENVSWYLDKTYDGSNAAGWFTGDDNWFMNDGKVRGINGSRVWKPDSCWAWYDAGIEEFVTDSDI